MEIMMITILIFGSLCAFCFESKKHINEINTYYMVSETMKLATEKSSFAFLCSMMTLPIYGAYHSSLQYLPNDFMFQNTLLTVLYVMIGLSCIYLIQALTNIFAFYYKKG